MICNQPIKTEFILSRSTVCISGHNKYTINLQRSQPNQAVEQPANHDNDDDEDDDDNNKQKNNDDNHKQKNNNKSDHNQTTEKRSVQKGFAPRRAKHFGSMESRASLAEL